jgi:hypothetical protein
VTAVADAASRFRYIAVTREGMTVLVRALKNHENSNATIAQRRAA